MLIMNEEEIRGKLLLPYLNDLGFDLSEVSLENSFSIRLGKSKHIIKGRSDILCKRNGKNLFIIELKNDQISIGQEDIDQAISYARLLIDNIAPFAIITNGKTTRIFDSISREELTGAQISTKSNYWLNHCSLSTETDLQIRYEALKNFISFSSENLKWFCEEQVASRMAPIIGGIDKPHAKYIKALYVERKELKIAFDNFIASSASIFGIVGSAGVGKTNAICSLALHKIEEEFVFFYNAALINKSPLEHIAQDLNGVFSSKSESDVVLKKLDEIGRFLNKKIIIFIDAIDENLHSDLTIELSEIALIARNLDKLKICISCKSSLWSNILKKNGEPTHLFEALNETHNLIASLDKCPGFLLDDFNNEEAHNIIPLYKKAFGFKGDISETVFKALKNGFFLRIFSEVYSQKEVPQEINDKELISIYIKQSLEKTTIGTLVASRILSKIGKILLEHKYESWHAFKDDGLEVESLMEKLEFALGESIPEDLFARNILIKSNNDDSYNVSFYYSKIRDYIISFRSYNLDKLDEDEFYNSLELFYENHIGQSAISFYIENASYSHQQTLVAFKENKFKSYANGYDVYLKEHFKEFKGKFDPETDGAIGISVSKSLLGSAGYALIPLSSNQDATLQYFKHNSSLSNPFHELFFEKGAKIIHGSSDYLMVKDQHKIIRQEIFKQLREIINKGKLNAYNSDILMLEQVSAILYFYSKQLGYKYQLIDHYLPRYDLIYPINLKDLRNRIYQFLASEYYKREKWYSNQIVYAQDIAEQVNLAIQANYELPKLNITGDFPPFEELFKIVDILINNGYDEIAEHHLPCPDLSVDEAKSLIKTEKTPGISQMMALQFSEERARLYIEMFLKHLDSCYREFVEYLFPTIKNRLRFFNTLPHEYFVYLKDSSALKWGYLGYRPSGSGELKINFRKMKSLDEPFPTEETHILIAFSLEQILHVDYNYRIKTFDKINTAKVDEFCVLRYWVYRFLKDDMKSIFEENQG